MFEQTARARWIKDEPEPTITTTAATTDDDDDNGRKKAPYQPNIYRYVDQ